MGQNAAHNQRNSPKSTFMGRMLPIIKERKDVHENNQRRHSQYRNHCSC